MRKFQLITVVAVVALILSCLPVAAQAATISFQDGANVTSSDGQINIPNYAGTQDATWYQYTPDNNYGGTTTLMAGVVASGKWYGSEIRFDLSALQGKYTSIDSMTLRLYTTAVSSTSATLKIATSPLVDGDKYWVEGTGDGTASQSGTMCWNKQQYNTVGSGKLFWRGRSAGPDLSHLQYRGGRHGKHLGRPSDRSEL